MWYLYFYPSEGSEYFFLGQYYPVLLYYTAWAACYLNEALILENHQSISCWKKHVRKIHIALQYVILRLIGPSTFDSIGLADSPQTNFTSALLRTIMCDVCLNGEHRSMEEATQRP